jgi:hypothetical protein
MSDGFSVLERDPADILKRRVVDVQNTARRYDVKVAVYFMDGVPSKVAEDDLLQLFMIGVIPVDVSV